mmetsp:Transcript_99773/g.177603  ORF Transcript_99773/g.177603 Transcript_99773/m.177603 type:complete len:543 (-) Transcript_99773:29-1657(-)
MGASGGKQQQNGLDNVVKRAEDRVGKLTISGRYHKKRSLEMDYTVLKKNVLGSGYNGQVYQAAPKSGGTGLYAVKGFKLNGVPKDKKDELEAECEIFLAMDHPHVARLVDVYATEDRLELVMECMSGKELFHRIQKAKRFTEKTASHTAWQMLLALNYIHQHGVVHRDIKLENFLYDSEDSDHLKLIDFGFSKIWAPNTTMKLSCGTLAYVAPEVLNQNYTSQCDMWSVGVSVFILLFGYMPFSGNEDKQISDIKAGRYARKPEKWKAVSSDAQDFVESLLVVDPRVRLTATNALNHRWIASRDSNTAELPVEIVGAIVDFGKVSSFRRACMSMMAWSLTNEERAQVRQAFIAMDQDKSGTIKLWEFKKVLDEKCKIKDEDAKKLFEALDTNHTDEIHYSEFLAAMVSTRIAMHDDLLKATFKRFDTDNSGRITVQNLREVLGDNFEGESVEKIMKEADMNGSGDISYEEWILYLKSGNSDEEKAELAAKVIDNQLLKSDGSDKTIEVSKSASQMVVSKSGNQTKADPSQADASDKKCCSLQ